MNLLIVEDEIDLLKFISDELCSYFNTVTIKVNSTQMAVEILKFNDVDLVISDYFVNQENDLEFQEHLKGLKSKAPVIFYLDSTLNRVKINEENVLGVVNKPNFEGVIELVEQYANFLAKQSSFASLEN